MPIPGVNMGILALNCKVCTSLEIQGLLVLRSNSPEIHGRPLLRRSLNGGERICIHLADENLAEDYRSENCRKGSSAIRG
ncbi:hypothetical protein CEXT_790501 [Caerostris extrusa]|uniref:Uncharacterized protein n=1 Tax=Caerostris extrusa TaxID=172846 RepID=A0AAV4WFE5_CAEEX|nr:hypothetical protein CEXT_790501 [Caerostris extrusa]